MKTTRLEGWGLAHKLEIKLNSKHYTTNRIGDKQELLDDNNEMQYTN
jgi:hypothetical protein